ncbi:ribosome small subunit-dependent GTPase A [Conexibacter woesei]|uniref:Small ribosomal subunit biogenesis GTPase RsgA n=1 Tax=Conexibacter woesei (strain DSM 14684 / CCUG 47730 / CIP 108061 / JCM 11494 / NBRC 100937 / ID131577) TaxID=469383 RepID=D3F0F5_CONWI|nr:ribosome small subunit-dependent GTPase A [Conexibacter woesei]ADB52015.1 GTPase EngC [Conexibacter woesei DSM 14684]
MTLFPAGIGRRDDLDAELATLRDALGEPGLSPARVLSQHSGVWLVAEPDAPEPRLVHARARLRDEAEGPPVTGDWVALDGGDAIAGVLPRHGAVVRRAVGEGRAERQVLAANVELALVAEPLPEPNERRAERLAAIAGAGEVPVALVLTKADLDDDADATALRLGRDLGLPDAIAVSVRTGDGIGIVRSLLPPGSTAVLLGPSGAGKSTLVNALLGEERQAVGDVRASDKRGRHTTVTRELLSLPNGGLLIDTPGMREVGMWDGGVDDTFDDVAELAAGCRFADCQHDSEPDCAVRGVVAPERLEAWRKLAREQAWVDDRRAAARERERLGRSYRGIQREARWVKGDE